MKLSRDTLAVLKNFASINSGIMLQPGNLIMTRAINRTTYAEAEIKDQIDIEAAIYDLTGFLNILSLSDEDAEISLEDDMQISIKSARSVIYWPSVDQSSIVYPKKRIPFPTASIIFELKADDYQHLQKVARGLGIDTIGITNKDSKIVLNGYNKTSDSRLDRPLYSVELANYDGENNFNFIFNMANLKMMNADYKVLIWVDEKDGKKFASKFEGPTASYVIALENASTHDFS